MVFPVVIYGFESWITKKVEYQKLMISTYGAGEDSRKSLYRKEIKPINPKGNQSWIFTGILKLNLQHFGYLIRRANSLEKTLILRDWGQEEKGQRMRRLDGIIDSMDMSLSRLWEMGKHREACCASVHRVMKMQTRLSNWLTTTD